MNREYITIIVVSVIFLVLTSVSLFYCFKENDHKRKLWKPYPIITLMTLIMVVLIKEPLLYVALLCGLIGDIFLLSFNKKMFLVGLGFFLIEHIINFYSLYHYFGVFNNTFFIVYPALVVFIILMSSIFLRKFAKPVFLIAGGFYMAILIMNIVFSIYTGIVTNTPLLFSYSIGYFFFLLSDSLIAQKRFIKPLPKIQFLIMVTYYIAQYMIYVPLLFILIK